MRVIRVLGIIAGGSALVLLFLALIFENQLFSFIGSCIGLLCTLLYSFLAYNAKKNNKK
jgi:hypothetical protein